MTLEVCTASNAAAELPADALHLLILRLCSGTQLTLAVENEIRILFQNKHLKYLKISRTEAMIGWVHSV